MIKLVKEYCTLDEYSNIYELEIGEVQRRINKGIIEVEYPNGRAMIVRYVKRFDNEKLAKSLKEKIFNPSIEESKAMQLLGLDKETIRQHLEPSLTIRYNRNTESKEIEYYYPLYKVQRLGRKKKLSISITKERTNKWDAIFTKRYGKAANALMDTSHAMNILNYYPIFNSCKPFNRDEIFSLTIRFIDFLSSESSSIINSKIGIFEHKSGKYWCDEIFIKGEKYTWFYPAGSETVGECKIIPIETIKTWSDISPSKPKLSEYKALVRWFLSESESLKM